MAGGTWSSQNKVRPGVYIRFKTAKPTGLTVGERGTVAIAEPLSWGPVGVVQTIEAGANTVPFTGYDITNANNRFLTEIFKGTNRTSAPTKVLLFRLLGTGAAIATATLDNLTATAKYAGVRGNDITIIITAETTGDTFTVDTVVDGDVVDEQTGAATVADLTNNDWVNWSGTGELAANVGVALQGGQNGTVDAAAYTSFLTAIEPYKFDVLIYDGSDPTVQAAMIGFVKRIAEESGVYSQLVTAGATNPDSRFVINVNSGITLEDGTELAANQVTWWVGGATAGASYNQGLTYATYPGAVDVSPKLTNSQYVAALNAGQFVLFADGGVVKVEQDINSLVTYTEDIGKVFHKNRVVRLCSTIANDVYDQFSANFVGVVNNNEAGRSRFKAAIVGYLLDIQGNQGIQNFTPDDVEVLPGADSDAVLINISVQAVDAAEKIYMTIEVS